MSEQAWSVPEADVMATARATLEEGGEAVMATIVDIEGSAYRRPGAKMVISKSGDGVGSITAGCLEDEIVRIARDVRERDLAEVRTFDLTGDDDIWGLGVGCNGVIDILFEPLDDTFWPAVKAYDRGHPMTVATVLESESPNIKRGERQTFEEADKNAFDSWPSWLSNHLQALAEEIHKTGGADVVTIEREEETIRVFLDGITPPADLVVFGTGHDVRPVVNLAKNLDFRVTVVGFRGATATNDRFPEADEVISTSPSAVRDVLDFDESTYVVVMSHNFVDDRLTLDELLQSPVPYVGLMGPRKRFEEMLDEFEQEGRTFSKDELNRLYTPIGLNIGGGSPYQIAHSIVAEVFAVKNERDPCHLKEREGSIHDRVTVSPDVS